MALKATWIKREATPPFSFVMLLKGDSMVSGSASNKVTDSNDHLKPVVQKTRAKPHALVWTVLAAILILYVFSAWRVDPIATFGTMRDDALYFSSAKALANGQGYILPSFPVPLRATKYPELYPLLLAGIWKLDPRFPGNVNLAVGMTLAFGCAALLFVFLLLRKWPGMDDWQALAIVALCAFTGHFLELSASVMTDVPFMAVMLGAIWMAECSQNCIRTGTRWVIGAGLLASLSMGFRSLGVAVVAGIGLVLLTRRDYRRLLWFALAASPLTLFFLWPALAALVLHHGARLAVNPGDSGWTQTLCYYSSYACNWRMDVSGPGALKGIILTNLKSIIQEPGSYLLLPLLSSNSLVNLVAVMLVSAAAYAGIMRYMLKVGLPSFPAVFFFFLPLILAWPYTPDRFLICFAPLFFGGLWIEGRHLAGLVAKHLRPEYRDPERVVAGLLAVGGMALLSIIVINYAKEVPSAITALANRNQRLLRDESGAYSWIRQHAAPDAKIIAYEDGLAFLYTHRTAAVPIQDVTQAFYLNDPRYAQHDAARLPDVACHIGASYWLFSTQDFLLDAHSDYSALQRGQLQLLVREPLVFHSADGRVRLYDVHGLSQAGCAVPK